jgi:hypothetical protein
MISPYRDNIEFMGHRWFDGNGYGIGMSRVSGWRTINGCSLEGGSDGNGYSFREPSTHSPEQMS